MIKELIKQRFTKSLKTYDKFASVQKIMANKLAETVEFSPKSILELGCGTGLLTKELITKINFEKYKAIDIVDCEKYISKLSDRINFECEDIENFYTNEKFDLIISNAVLQWIENLPEFINKTKHNLSQNGYFIFTLFGKNNYKELQPIIHSPMKYYSIEELRKIFNDYNITKLYEEEIILNFKTPKDVLYHMKNTGVNALSKTHWTRTDLINFEKNYTEICKGNITLTYNPVYIVLKT